jgi:hypothetical protein
LESKALALGRTKLKLWTPTNKMKPTELLENLKKLDLGKALKLCALKLTTVPYQQAAEVKQALEKFQPQQGWLCFQDTVTYFKNSDLPDEGVILYGEVKSNNNKVLHIQPNNTGGWLLTTYQEQAGETHLVESTQLLGEFEDSGNLAYKVYWQNDGEQGYRPICAAFAGFKKQETNKK